MGSSVTRRKRKRRRRKEILQNSPNDFVVMGDFIALRMAVFQDIVGIIWIS
jgi:hypothetical protein